MAYLGTAARFVLVIAALMLIGYVFPGFSAMTIGEAALVALVIGVLGYGIHIFLRPKSPRNVRGLIGFVVAGIVIWLGQFVVPHLHVSLVAALFTAALIGLVNYAIPDAPA